MAIQGFHHITLVTRDAQENLDFWAGALGLRLVKRTVNFDDPGSYHLYYGDRLGRPGTAITYFEWPWTQPGRRGVGGTLRFSLGYADATLERLAQQLAAAGVAAQATATGLELTDPEGMPIAVQPVGGSAAADAERWRPGVTELAIAVSDLAATRAFYGDFLGLGAERIAVDGGRPALRFGFGAASTAQLVAIEEDVAGHARHGAGAVHHFAFAVADDAVQRDFRARFHAADLPVSPVMDRVYFKSIYSRDPDGHIVELATAGPGFTIDEPEETLGGALRLPPWLENERARIAASLAPLVVRPLEVAR